MTTSINTLYRVFCTNTFIIDEDHSWPTMTICAETREGYDGYIRLHHY